MLLFHSTYLASRYALHSFHREVIALSRRTDSLTNLCSGLALARIEPALCPEGLHLRTRRPKQGSLFLIQLYLWECRDSHR